MKSSLIAIVLVILCVASANAQPVLTPRNVALGGGGSTYITDYNANFYNPANLMIKDRERNIDIGVGVIGTYFNGVQNSTNLNQQRKNLQDYLSIYTPGNYNISGLERSQIVDDNYPRLRESSHHQTRFDLTLFGIKWRKNDKAYSFAVRNRVASSFEVGRGWYSSTPLDTPDQTVINRTLRHKFQSLFEVSFGYSESFSFFSDMTPRLDEFLIGIAPKVVLAGPLQDAAWTNTYFENNTGGIEHISQFNYLSTGQFTSATNAYLSGQTAENAVTQNITNTVAVLDGYGIGMDLGLTYLITFGSDLSTIAGTQNRTQKSLRVSFSITDLGLIYYPENSIELNARLDTVTSPTGYPNLQASTAYVGAPGQFIDFVDQFSSDNPFSSFNSPVNSEPVTTLLPTALHSGLLFEFNRIKLMGDLSLGLTNNAFNNKKLVASAGIEVRPLPFLPLRAGTRVASQLPSFFSFGAAIETKVWDLSVATQISSSSFNSNPAISGVTVATLQFHF